jgi:hypothetical protein
MEQNKKVSPSSDLSQNDQQVPTNPLQNLAQLPQ